MGEEEKQVDEHLYGREYKHKHYPAFLESLPDAKGKNVVITGTTSGTGFVAAKASLIKGATVALLNRNTEKAKTAMKSFFEENEGTEERTHFVLCDLQDFDSVKAAAEKIWEIFEDGVDVITNNAGVMALEDKATKDGYDVQMQTNHLSHFMLTKLIFPLLSKRAEEKGEARVVNHSSGARLLPPTPLKAKYFGKNGGKLGGNGSSMVKGGARWQRYHQTKLANSVFTYEMQKRCTKAGSKVISLCAHPGLAATNLQATTTKDGGMKDTNNFMKRAQSQEDGTMGLLRCMFDPNVKKGALYGPKWMTGKAVKVKHGIFTTSKAGKMLWRESEKACGEFDVGEIKADAKSVPGADEEADEHEEGDAGKEGEEPEKDEEADEHEEGDAGKESEEPEKEVEADQE